MPSCPSSVVVISSVCFISINNWYFYSNFENFPSCRQAYGWLSVIGNIAKKLMKIHKKGSGDFLSLRSHLEITRVISRTNSGFAMLYVNVISLDQWPGSVVREYTRTSDPGTTFGPDQLICERYSFLGPPLWCCGLYEEERTHLGSWLHFSPAACSRSTNMG